MIFQPQPLFKKNVRFVVPDKVDIFFDELLRLRIRGQENKDRWGCGDMA